MESRTQATSESLRRFVLIGDVHAEDILLKRAIDEAGKHGFETVLCTGDIPDGKGEPNRCCLLLEQSGAFAVKGNHEHWMLDGIDYGLQDCTPRSVFTEQSLGYLESLPPVWLFPSPIGEVLLCHGLHTNDMGKADFDDPLYILDQNYDLQELLRRTSARLVLNGHTHKFQIGYYRSRCFINAGTLRRDRNPSFHLIDLVNRSVQSFGFDQENPVRREQFLLEPN